uniref:Uncharacterized protein n=1 Tax=Rhizophora mucronata TaxID=61149 RepID=A0A2P2IIH4_RHIMU
MVRLLRLVLYNDGVLYFFRYHAVCANSLQSICFLFLLANASR